MAYDDVIYVEEVVGPIKSNETLLGKPKLFFLQACRGLGYMSGWKFKDTTRQADQSDGASCSSKRCCSITHTKHTIKLNQPDKLEIDPNSDELDFVQFKWPVDADVLIHYAQSEGVTSTRNPYVGSSFILGLVYFLKFAYRYEIHDLLIRVNALVALRETHTASPEADGKKQMPQVHSQLTRLLRFKPMTNSEDVRQKIEKIEYDHDNVELVNGVPMMTCRPS